jgi:hypothetical protein
VCRSMLNPLVSLSFSDACVSLDVKPFGVSLSFSDACVSLYVKPFRVSLSFSDACVSLYVKPVGVSLIFFDAYVSLSHMHQKSYKDAKRFNIERQTCIRKASRCQRV